MTVESKKIEELLRPRYKVVVDYPYSPFSKGEILKEYNGAGKNNKNYWTLDRGGLYQIYLHSFPAIFKPLQWWEDRDEKDMPEYVKCIKTPDQVIMPGNVLKIVEWFSKDCGRYDPKPFRIAVMSTGCFEPATFTEYEQYKSNK